MTSVQRPERWESLPEKVKTIPGIWGNMLSFLGGPRACIGYLFSVIELVDSLSELPLHEQLMKHRMKALLFVLVRAFEFELAVPVEDIIKKTAVVQRPLVLSDPAGGNQMPLLIKPYNV
jgi:hypothetical protein